MDVLLRKLSHLIDRLFPTIPAERRRREAERATELRELEALEADRAWRVKSARIGGGRVPRTSWDPDVW